MVYHASHATKEDGTLYLIWSHEHGAWWGPGRSGYVRSISKAGRYSREEALRICAEAIPGDAKRLGALPELPVPEADLHEMRDHFRSLLPDDPTEAWE
jgi:hypothetical protein